MMAVYKTTFCRTLLYRAESKVRMRVLRQKNISNGAVTHALRLKCIQDSEWGRTFVGMDMFNGRHLRASLNIRCQRD